MVLHFSTRLVLLDSVYPNVARLERIVSSASRSRLEMLMRAPNAVHQFGSGQQRVEPFLSGGCTLGLPPMTK
jgi:hypothetical protein